MVPCMLLSAVCGAAPCTCVVPVSLYVSVAAPSGGVSLCRFLLPFVLAVLFGTFVDTGTRKTANVSNGSARSCWRLKLFVAAEVRKCVPHPGERAKSADTAIQGATRADGPLLDSATGGEQRASERFRETGMKGVKFHGISDFDFSTTVGRAARSVCLRLRALAKPGLLLINIICVIIDHGESRQRVRCFVEHPSASARKHVHVCGVGSAAHRSHAILSWRYQRAAEVPPT